ncbi:hypothetical protein [Streptomyces sp. NBC_00076]|uniref:hypothetical protein n=1 Tax=Streptomyces sp. NBC_00076 TaxID=2975642 RepID=UPI00037FD7D7
MALTPPIQPRLAEARRQWVAEEKTQATAPAAATLRAARALFPSAIDDSWHAAAGPSDAVPLDLRTDLRLAATRTAHTSVEVER